MVLYSKDYDSLNLIGEVYGYKMGKMADRRRKKKKKKTKLSKLIESLGFIKPRIIPPPVGHAFKSPKDYNRSNNKKIIDSESDE